MSEVEAIKAVSDALEGLEKDAQTRVLAWASAKFGAGSLVGAPVQSTSSTKPDDTSITKPPAVMQAVSKGKGGRKAKTIISMDKTLNLAPAGKDSAMEFSAAKNPSNVKEKCVVAAYYLRDFLEVERVTTQGVFTFFKTVQWPTPTDLRNTLQQAGTEGWLDTADGDDIKLTSLGENLVEHSLPKKPKVK